MVVPVGDLLEDPDVAVDNGILTVLDEVGEVIPLGGLLEDPGVTGATEVMTLLDETRFTVVGT